MGLSRTCKVQEAENLTRTDKTLTFRNKNNKYMPSNNLISYLLLGMLGSKLQSLTWSIFPIGYCSDLWASMLQTDNQNSDRKSYTVTWYLVVEIVASVVQSQLSKDIKTVKNQALMYHLEEEGNMNLTESIRKI